MANASEPVIRVEGVQKSFGANHVLRGVDFEVMPGEVVTIIGASGSGKSTLLRCINLLETPDAGHVWFHGEDLAAEHVNVNRLRESIGMVFQGFNLFPHLTAKQNVMIGQTKVLKKSKEEAEAEAMKQLTAVGLADRADFKPAQLSGGQQQRVSIARALAGNPSVILADEPTGALDSRTGRDVLNFLQKLNAEGDTVVLITHDNSIAVRAKRIVRLQDGTLHYLTFGFRNTSE